MWIAWTVRSYSSDLWTWQCPGGETLDKLVAGCTAKTAKPATHKLHKGRLIEPHQRVSVSGAAYTEKRACCLGGRSAPHSSVVFNISCKDEAVSMRHTTTLNWISRLAIVFVCLWTFVAAHYTCLERDEVGQEDDVLTTAFPYPEILPTPTPDATPSVVLPAPVQVTPFPIITPVIEPPDAIPTDIIPTPTIAEDVPYQVPATPDPTMPIETPVPTDAAPLPTMTPPNADAAAASPTMDAPGVLMPSGDVDAAPLPMASPTNTDAAAASPTMDAPVLAMSPDEATNMPSATIAAPMPSQSAVTLAPNQIAAPLNGDTNSNGDTTGANGTAGITTPAESSGSSLPPSNIAVVTIGTVAVVGSVALIGYFVTGTTLFRRRGADAAAALSLSKDNMSGGVAINRTRAYPWSNDNGAAVERGVPPPAIVTGTTATAAGAAATGRVSAGIYNHKRPHTLQTITPNSHACHQNAAFLPVPDPTDAQDLEPTHLYSHFVTDYPRPTTMYQDRVVVEPFNAHFQQAQRAPTARPSIRDLQKSNIPPWLGSPTWIENVANAPAGQPSAQTRTPNNAELRKLWILNQQPQQQV
ncbi:hypothetical protein SeLEV6574_g05100 [Synchytrium endobioticum]|uniref:Uncharacterized protein n=1 Tax=Synchytrium endobioticum TaxID=286115 RepID=A0A507CW37_9FUNG|nr:hypothetical protein SeLEV6574_g05100 [Synchytrium endobioticum]